MQKFATASVFLHLALVLVGYFGLPSFQRDVGPQDVPITVEILTVTDVTNVPVMAKATKQPEPKPKPKPSPPPSTPTASKAPPPPLPPEEPEPVEPSQTALVVEPETRPKPKAKEKPRPKDTPVRKQPKPKRKPAPPDPFASVLKTLDEMQSQPRTEKTEKKKTKTPDEQAFEQMAEALKTQTLRRDLGPSLTISEIDLVRQQIARCWNLPAGAKDAHEMVVDIRVTVERDGSVRGATIVNQAQMGTDPFFRAMAESALRAVLNPNCSPLKLPAEKYEDWRDLKLSFNPKEMFGL